MALPMIAPAAAGAPQFLAVIADDVTRENLRQVAGQLGWSNAAVSAGGITEAIALLARHTSAPALLVVDVSGCADSAGALDELAEVCDPATRVVAIGDVNDVALYRRLIGLGLADYLVKPTSAVQLKDALLRAQRLEADPAPATKAAARTVALIGARGGVGVTALAASLGWSLAQEQGLRTVLLDLDLQQGALALTLDLEPGRGLRDLLSAPERIDSLLVGSAAAQHSERLRLLSAEEALDQDLRLDPLGLGALLAALSDGADTVIMDLPRRLDAVARGALADADVAVVVTDLSLSGLRDTQRLLAYLAAARSTGETLVVANRAGAVPGEVPREEFERGIGRTLDALVPADLKAATAAAQQGEALLHAAKDGPMAVELRRLACRLAGAAAPGAPAPGAGSLLKRLLGR